MAINYAAINAKAVNSILSAKKHINSIGGDLRALMELRVSQINGCTYCIDLHSNEARRGGVSEQKLDHLSAWKKSGLFSEREMAALNWAESVTNISSETNIDSKLNSLLKQFSEQEVVDLTLIVSLMNCLNRMAISFGDKPENRGE